VLKVKVTRLYIFERKNASNLKNL